jgi:hypothetical protein
MTDYALPNTLRGEVVFTAHGRNYTLRPSFDAIARIESIVGGSFFGYVQSLNSSEVKVTDLAKIVAACCIDAAPEEIGPAIVEYGLLPFLNGPFSELMARGAGFHESLEQEQSAGK